MTRPKNIFVVGLDEFNLRYLRHVEQEGRYRYIELLDKETARGGEGFEISFNDLLSRAQHQLDAFEGSIDAIIGYWDHPVMPMVSVLADRYGTVAPSLESVVKCEHKYWSRVVQSAVTDRLPDFTVFDPFDDNAFSHVQEHGFPMWIKPVVGTGSMLGFKANNAAEFERARSAIRDQIEPLANSFDEVLAHLDLPAEIEGVTGRFCLAESVSYGEQCTVSGYVYRDEVTAYGVVDSVNFPGTTSFQRYEYPSELPMPAQERMQALTKRLVEHIGLRNATFNIEYFYDSGSDHLHLLEVNARMSPSHGDVYEKVDGLPNHQLLVDLALGVKPTWKKGQGPFAKSAKCFMRHFEADAIARRIPHGEEVAAIEQKYPGTKIRILPEEGRPLSESENIGEPFSYTLAHIFLGADSREDLERKYDRIVSELHFELEDIEA